MNRVFKTLFFHFKCPVHTTDLYHFIPYTKKVSTPLFTVTTILEIIKFVLFFLYSYRMRYNKGVHTIKVTATKTGMFFTNDVY